MVEQDSTAARAVNRKSRIGTVVSDKNDQTVVVEIVRAARHRLYRKVIRRSRKYHVHDPENTATVGDLVRIEESRPMSRLKRWRLVEVLTERAVAEVAPEALDRELVDEMQRSASRAAAEDEEAGPEAAASEASTPEVTAPEATAEPAASDEPSGGDQAAAADAEEKAE